MAWTRDVADAQHTLDTVSKQQHALPTSTAFSMLPDNQVLRVFQLDALTSQSEIVDILRASLYQIFDIGPLQWVRFRYQEELLLALNCVLYRFSTWESAQSVGDRLQNLVMRDEERARDLGLSSSSSLVANLAPNRRLLLVHAVLTTLLPYAVRKLQRRSLEEGWEQEDSGSWKHRLSKGVRYALIAHSAIALLNILCFLVTGQYRCLVERLLRLRPVYGSQRMVRFTNLMYLNQHVWWQTWTSLLSLLHIGRYFMRLVRSMQTIGASSGILTEKVCCACHELPTLCQRSNCGHLYCYYCIKSRLAEDKSTASFRCFRCGQTVHDCGPA